MDYDEKIQVAVGEAGDTKTDHTLTLSKGVVLRTKSVAPLRITAVTERFKYPPVPEVYDPVKDRSMRNPESPIYLEARAEVDEQRTMALIDALIAFGTEVVSVPEGMPRVEDQSWIDDLSIVNIPVRVELPLARYLAWVKYVALAEKEDLPLLVRAFGLQAGSSEENVSAAMAGHFPRNP